MYLTDVSDHIKLNLDAVDTYLEMCDTMNELYTNAQSKRMSDIMQVRDGGCESNCWFFPAVLRASQG